MLYCSDNTTVWVEVFYIATPPPYGLKATTDVLTYEIFHVRLSN